MRATWDSWSTDKTKYIQDFAHGRIFQKYLSSRSSQHLLHIFPKVLSQLLRYFSQIHHMIKNMIATWDSWSTDKSKYIQDLAHGRIFKKYLSRRSSQHLRTFCHCKICKRYRLCYSRYFSQIHHMINLVRQLHKNIELRAERQLGHY
jgi:hypothetical protein